MASRFRFSPPARGLMPRGSLHAWATAVWLAAAVVAASESADRVPERLGDLKSASLEELFFHAQRYATTPEKKARKEQARAELRARGGEALAFLVAHSHIENPWYFMLADELTSQLPSKEAVPALLAALSADSSAVRKTAVFFLGFHDAPEHAPKVLPLLEEDEVAGAAARTLGRWRVREAVPALVCMLADARERRRILAANALGRIGDAAAIPPLIAALDDPLFTVRTSAANALAAFGAEAEPALLGALSEGSRIQQRHIIRLLGTVGTRQSEPALRSLLGGADPGVREDAAAALEQILAGPASSAADVRAEGSLTRGPAPERIAPTTPHPAGLAPFLPSAAVARPPACFLRAGGSSRLGPFRLEEDAEWIVNERRCTVVEIRKPFFSLKAAESGSLLGPFEFKDGALCEIGTDRWVVEVVPPRIAGVLSHPDLLPGSAAVHLVRVSPSVWDELARLRQNVRAIRQDLAEATSPLRLRTPTVDGAPGWRRSPWIERSAADQARWQRQAASRASRALDVFLERVRADSVRLPSDGRFAFDRLAPGRYFVCGKGMSRTRAEATAPGPRPLVWWDDVTVEDGSFEIVFDEAHCVGWETLFPD